MANPRTQAQRQKNKETIELARKIRFEREQEFLENKEGYRLKKSRSVNFLDYYQTYIKKYTKKDVRVIEMGLNDFKKFLAEKYPHFSTRVEPRYINKKMMEEFAEYISEHHRGTGISSVHRRFKKVILAGVEDRLFSENPCKGIVLDNKEDMLVKDILSAEELQQLFSTPYTWKYPDIRRAFAMTCFFGIRFCDVEALTYGDVDYANRIVSFRQKKTVGHSHKSGVVMPLNDTLMAIVGEMPKDTCIYIIMYSRLYVYMCTYKHKNTSTRKQQNIESCSCHSRHSVLLLSVPLWTAVHTNVELTLRRTKCCFASIDVGVLRALVAGHDGNGTDFRPLPAYRVPCWAFVPSTRSAGCGRSGTDDGTA